MAASTSPATTPAVSTVPRTIVGFNKPAVPAPTAPKRSRAKKSKSTPQDVAGAVAASGISTSETAPVKEELAGALKVDDEEEVEEEVEVKKTSAVEAVQKRIRAATKKIVSSTYLLIGSGVKWCEGSIEETQFITCYKGLKDRLGMCFTSYECAALPAVTSLRAMKLQFTRSGKSGVVLSALKSVYFDTSRYRVLTRIAIHCLATYRHLPGEDRRSQPGSASCCSQQACSRSCCARTRRIARYCQGKSPSKSL